MPFSVSQEKIVRIALLCLAVRGGDKPYETNSRNQLSLRECLRPLFSRGRSRPGCYLHFLLGQRRLDYRSSEHAWPWRASSLTVVIAVYLRQPDSTRRFCSDRRAPRFCPQPLPFLSAWRLWPSQHGGPTH